MKTIDEISKHIKESGYSGLTDDEINSWIQFQEQLALRDAEFQKKMSMYDQILKDKAAESKRAANAAIEAVQNIMNTPLNLKKVDE